MKGVWLARGVRRASKRDFYSALTALVNPVQKFVSLTMNYILTYVSQRPAAWAGSRAGSPVSECVSLIDKMNPFLQFCKKYRNLVHVKNFLKRHALAKLNSNES
jgi:hypothetical protein